LGARPFTVTDVPFSDWRTGMSIKVTAASCVLRAAAKGLVEQGEGRAIIGVSSTSAVRGARGQEHYAASKTAMLALIQSLGGTAPPRRVVR
jgi:NAD(P)-dependent dehydrogenase (short-subunit alcohol dehydrogenase family)